MVSRVRGGRSPYCRHNTVTEETWEGQRKRRRDDEEDRGHREDRYQPMNELEAVYAQFPSVGQTVTGTNC